MWAEGGVFDDVVLGKRSAVVGWLLGAIGVVAFWGLIIWAIWYFVTSLTRHPGHDHPPADPRRVLDGRLARGEIDAEEYKQLRDLMRGDEVGAGNGRSPVGTAEKR